MVLPDRLKAALGVLVSATTLIAADICDDFKEKGFDVDKPLSLDYEKEQANYWSQACSAMRPRCILAPGSAEQVAEIVTALHETNDLFAVKSGGHMPNNGFASIDGGILISTKNLDQAVYDSHTKTVIAGPGLEWQQLMEAIKDTGRTVVGGRMGEVGVGGYLLGGGLSFLSSQYGWGVNSILNFEIVLANGTIVNANATSNPDLYASLKGGGNNFGIVTAFTLETHPMEQKAWGGNLIFTADKTPEILEAVYHFTTNYPDDKAGIIMTANKGLLVDLWIMFLFYDGIEPPLGVFDNFTAIGPILSTTKTTSYLDLVKQNNQFILRGQRYVIATETLPLPSSGTDPKAGIEVLQSLYDHFKDTAKSILEVPALIASIALQPLPRAVTRKAAERGGDLMSFSPDHDYIVLEYDYSYIGAANDRKVDSATQTLYSGSKNLIQRNIDNGVLPDIHRPLFMNDAYYRQDYWGRLGAEQRELAMAVRRDVDPQKFWQDRTSGGFRLG
ncbi:hypothetical protein VTO42DRAFT_178 [Malbranchea cinnamomea]